MADDDRRQDAAESTVRRTLIQVLIVQIVALALLGFLQIRYNL